jgi:hypothetical protein
MKISTGIIFIYILMCKGFGLYPPSYALSLIPLPSHWYQNPRLDLFCLQ